MARKRFLLRAASVLFTAALALPSAFAASPLVRASVADTFIRSDSPTASNGSNSLVIVGDTATADTALHGLLSFDLAQSGLAGATLQNVELQLTIESLDTASGGSHDSPHTLNLHSLTETFDESSATWSNRNASATWTTAGGTFAAEVIAYASANPARVNPGDSIVFGGARLQDLVRDAIAAGGKLNLLLKLATEDAVRSVFRFNSRSSATAAPRLVIDYTPPPADHVSPVEPVPGHPERPLSSRYTLTADGVPVEVRAERFSFDVAMFTLPSGTSVPIAVTIPAGSASWSLRPARHNLNVTRQGDTLRFQIDQPLRLVLQVDSLTPLAILVTPPETDVPSPSAPNVVYFPPGITDAGVIRPLSNQTIYLAPGALVKGRIEASDVSNVSIRGRGILETTAYAARATQKYGILFERSRDILVEGIGLRSYYTWWQTLYLNSRDIEVAHMNIFGLGVNTDGVDIDGVRDFLVRDTFIRAEDDGLGWHSLDAKANGEPITERARATDLVIWNTGAGNGVRIGASMETQLWRDITIENTDILMHATNGAGLYSDFSDWAWAENLVFRNITIERATQPITFKILKTNYSNSNGFLNERGHYEGLIFDKVTMNGGAITLAGFDANHRIDQVYFNDCTNAGVPLASASQITANAYVTGLFFNQPVPAPLPFPPGRHEAERLESATNLRPQITYADATLANGKGRRLLATAAGDYVEYSLELPSAGLFHLALGVKRGPAAGRFRLALDGVPLSDERDLHAATATTEALDLGLVSVASPGRHTLRLTVSGKSTASSGHELDVDYFHLTPALDAFRKLHFGNDPAPEIADDSADPDGDGVPNLIEYALGADPTRSESGLVVTALDAASRLTLTFTQVITQGLAYSVESSSDLQTWTGIQLTDASGGSPVNYIDTLELAPGERRFLRLRVSVVSP